MRTTQKFIVTAIAGYGLLFLTEQKAAAPSKVATSVPAVFTAAQAAAGRTAYLSTCAKCHLDTLAGRTGDASELPPISSLPKVMQDVIKGARGNIPPLAGVDFMARWSAHTTKELAVRIRDAVGGFRPEGATEDTYLDLAAYILQANGAQSGTPAFTKDTALEIRSVVKGIASPAAPVPPRPEFRAHGHGGGAGK